MAYTPHITGLYYSLYKSTNRGFNHCSSGKLQKTPPQKKIRPFFAVAFPNPKTNHIFFTEGTLGLRYTEDATIDQWNSQNICIHQSQLEVLALHLHEKVLFGGLRLFARFLIARFLSFFAPPRVAHLGFLMLSKPEAMGSKGCV